RWHRLMLPWTNNQRNPRTARTGYPGATVNAAVEWLPTKTWWHRRENSAQPEGLAAKYSEGITSGPAESNRPLQRIPHTTRGGGPVGHSSSFCCRPLPTPCIADALLTLSNG